MSLYIQKTYAQSTDSFANCKTLGTNATAVKNAIGRNYNKSLGSFNFTSQRASGERSGNDKIILNTNGYSSSLKSGYTDKFDPFHPNATNTTVNYKITRCSEPISRYIYMSGKGEFNDYADLGGDPSRSYIYEVYLLVAKNSDKSKQYAIGPQRIEYQPSAENSSINAIVLTQVADAKECQGNSVGTYTGGNRPEQKNNQSE